MLGSDSSTIVVIIRANERHRPIGSLNRLYTSLLPLIGGTEDRKSTRLNSSHSQISYAVFCLKKKTYIERRTRTKRSCSNSSNASETSSGVDWQSGTCAQRSSM